MNKQSDSLLKQIRVVDVRRKCRILPYIITGLNDGGAEAVLYRLCTSDTENRHVVISLMDEGKYGPLLRAAGVEVYTLGMPRRKVTIGALSVYGAYCGPCVRMWLKRGCTTRILSGELLRVSQEYRRSAGEYAILHWIPV